MDAWKNKLCKVPHCDHYASREIDLLPICPQHAWELAQHFRPILTEAARLGAQRVAENQRESREHVRGNREPPVVYYVRIGGYIKIGYTTRLRNRLATLRIDELLAAEPGGSELERQRHREFTAERIDLKRENFRPSPALEAHIAELRALHPLPHWASQPRTSVISRRHEETA